MRLRSFALVWAGVGVVALGLAGCGGGDAGAPAATGAHENAAALSSAASTVSVKTVVPGVGNALVCLDVNTNGACDATEAQARTGVTGAATLKVPSTRVGQYPLLAVVGTDAVERDHGAVPTRYVLQAPADRPGLITPLTTLVQAHVEVAGVGTAAAAAFIQAQAALAQSPLQDDAGTARTATLARLVVLTLQRQARVLQPAVVGQRDLSGATATQPQLDRVLRHALLGALPALGAAASATALETAADAQPLLAELAADVAAHELNLDAPRALAAIGMAKLPDILGSGPPQPGATLRGFSFTDTGHWFYRAMESTAADNTPDTAGLYRYTSVYRRAAGGTLSTWGFNLDPARSNDLHWNGQSWVACPLGFRSVQTARDADGRAGYDFCGRFEQGSTVHAALDIGGQSLRSVLLNRIRSFPGRIDGVDYARWGPADPALLGRAKFPAGSKLHYLRSLVSATAPAYDVRPSAVVVAYPGAVAAGGDARSARPACASAGDASLIQPSSLELLVVLNPGRPCLLPAAVSASGKSLVPNEWWGNSTASLGNLSDAVTPPAGTGGYYNTTAALRVSFGPSNATTYYKCLQRASDGSTRNCQLIGRGRYEIRRLGDARVMSFTGLPLLSQRLGWSRVIVERAGQLHHGYQSAAGAVSYQLRLNLAATNAVLGQLGLSPIVPQ